MKTIRQVVVENRQFPELSLVPALEAREKERDKAERERVKAVSESWIEAVIKGHKVISLKSLMDNIYPSQGLELKKLPAGYYWARLRGEGGEWKCENYENRFQPYDWVEYRRWDDPPLEVTGEKS